MEVDTVVDVTCSSSSTVLSRLSIANNTNLLRMTSLPPSCQDRCSPDSSRHVFATSIPASEKLALSVFPAINGSDARGAGGDSGRQQCDFSSSVEKAGSVEKKPHPLFRCHLCSYSGNSKYHFKNHLDSHFQARQMQHAQLQFLHATSAFLQTKSATDVEMDDDDTEDRIIQPASSSSSASVSPSPTGSTNLASTTPVSLTQMSLSHCEKSPERDAQLVSTVPPPAADSQEPSEELDKTNMSSDECSSKDTSTTGTTTGTNSNSSNKSRLKCKQCGFVATDKQELWAHSRAEHIKAERALKCPKCPFVTEYKHHLEYHVRNHFGSKPFRCDQCAYACVNKSMLNSHMKSHSTVYQYRCADCSYATKYCHSLKLHLRKYNHNPDVVLNADGTPNPLPIIDVYGTRRGPKAKKQPKKEPATSFLPLLGGLPMVGNPGGQNLQQHQQQHQPQHPWATMQQVVAHLLRQAAPEQLVDHLLQGQGPQFQGQLLGQGQGQPKRSTMPPRGALRCNMCTFVTADRKQFSQHVLLHAANESRLQGHQQPIVCTPNTNNNNNHQNNGGKTGYSEVDEEEFDDDDVEEEEEEEEGEDDEEDEHCNSRGLVEEEDEMQDQDEVMGTMNVMPGLLPRTQDSRFNKDKGFPGNQVPWPLGNLLQSPLPATGMNSSTLPWNKHPTDSVPSPLDLSSNFVCL
ncbi:unnamed protein product [Notodromas monacha]|uniref:Protein hunchback n=1 Tax=Notodromas monacha TaxID=399045 RepID=A0A7R9GHZ0_9CRUS|nr:unnamed protein product [Notodromas monacha]CAG0923304.1 unnamed protein product [Notodromas monacha]